MEKIGFTAGAFDPLHAGHMLMLEEAKQQCDYLIVGLHVDPSSERSTKHKPYLTVSERHLILKGVSYIDEVVVYESEAELESLLRALPIHIRIIGEDYLDKDFTGKELIEQGMMQVHYNRRQHPWSSTKVLKEIQGA